MTLVRWMLVALAGWLLVPPVMRPAPTPLTVVSVRPQPDGTTTATLAWSANPTPPSGYKLYAGTRSGQYTMHNDVGLATTGTITAATPAIATPYFFAVTAYDVGPPFMESDLSPEVSAVFPAAAPPANPCLTATGTNVLAMVLKGYQTTVKAPGPGWVVGQVLQYPAAGATTPAPVTSLIAKLSDGSIVANISGAAMANVRIWSGIWIRPQKAGSYQLSLTVTNADGCAAESAHVPLTVQ